MMRLLSFISITLVLLLPLQGSAQEPPELDAFVERAVESGIDRALVTTVASRAGESGFTAQETTELLQSAVRLASEGLPARPVLGKALEGLAKGVPFTRLHPVVGELETHTLEVGRYVRGWARRSDVQPVLGDAGRVSNEGGVATVIESAARSRMRGASSDLVRGFLDRLPENSSRRPIGTDEIATGLHVLPDMPDANAAPAQTARLVTAALDARLPTERVRQMPGALRSAARQRGQPVEALARGAASELAAGTPAAEVLDGLFEGGRPGVGPPGVRRGGAPDDVPPGQDLPPEAGPPTDNPGRNGQGSDGPPNRGPSGNGPPNDGGG